MNSSPKMAIPLWTPTSVSYQETETMYLDDTIPSSPYPSHVDHHPSTDAYYDLDTSLVNPEKLNLILDLDHTLLHTLPLYDLRDEERYLTDAANPRPDLFVYEDGVRKATKLRPNVGAFLEEASSMFQLHIYTKGNRRYANRMAAFLDPNGEYFASSSRVISCQDHGIVGKVKSLDAVEGCKCSNSIILDDSMKAWSEENWGNLLLMDKYYFFKGENKQQRSKSYAESKTDEIGYFDYVLQFLRMINVVYCEAVASNPNSGVDFRDVSRFFKTMID